MEQQEQEQEQQENMEEEVEDGEIIENDDEQPLENGDDHDHDEFVLYDDKQDRNDPDFTLLQNKTKKKKIVHHHPSDNSNSYRDQHPYFSCLFCNIKFESLFESRQHTSSGFHGDSTKRGFWSCKICKYDYGSYRSLYQHRLKGHKNLPVNRAKGETPNNEPLRGREDAQGDIILDNDDDEVLNKPSSSSSRKSQSHGLGEKDAKKQRQYRQKSKSKSYPYICPVCLRSFKHRVDLKDHDKDVHGSVKEWKCGLCPEKVYHKDRKISLIRHWERNHKDFPGYFIPKDTKK
jgi:hypothetical protein